MKAKLFSLVGVASLAASLAIPATANAAGGAVILDSCPDGLATGVRGGWTFTYCWHSTTTPSGHAVATLHGRILDPAPLQTVIVTGWDCYPDNLTLSYDSRLVVRPDGTMNAVCLLR